MFAGSLTLAGFLYRIWAFICTLCISRIGIRENNLRPYTCILRGESFNHTVLVGNDVFPPAGELYVVKSPVSF